MGSADPWHEILVSGTQGLNLCPLHCWTDPLTSGPPGKVPCPFSKWESIDLWGELKILFHHHLRVIGNSTFEVAFLESSLASLFKSHIPQALPLKSGIRLSPTSPAHTCSKLITFKLDDQLNWDFTGCLILAFSLPPTLPRRTPPKMPIRSGQF